MRKILFAFALIFFLSTVAMAQNTRFGFNVGATYSTMFSKINGEKDMGDYRIGATFGVMVDVPMEKNGSFRTGVNFVQKGTRSEYTDGQDEIKETLTLNYVEVPMMVMFKLPSKSANFRLGAGPVAGFALSGTAKTQVNGGSEDESDIDFGDKTDSEMNWVDFGINFQAEYEFNGGVFIGLNYNHGINRLFVGGAETDKLYNRNFGLRIGYFLGKKK